MNKNDPRLSPTFPPHPTQQKRDLHLVCDPIWVTVFAEGPLHTRGHQRATENEEGEYIYEVFSYYNATINDVLRRAANHGLGSPSTHSLTTLGGRLLNDRNITLFEANKKRDIEVVKGYEGLHLILRPNHRQAIPDGQRNLPPTDSSQRDEDNKGAVRLRGSGDNSHSSINNTCAPGECLGCGSKSTAGTQCPECGAPVEPLDQSFHYDFGWKPGPRPHTVVSIENNHSPSAKEPLINRLLDSLTGILKPPHSPRATELMREALLKLQGSQITRLINLKPSMRVRDVACITSFHISNISPRMSRFYNLITISQPAKLTALFGLMARSPIFADLLKISGTDGVNVETILNYINELSSWAHLKVATVGSLHDIPNPFPSAELSHIQAAYNIATYDDSISQDAIINDIFEAATGTLKLIILNHDLPIRRALRSVDKSALRSWAKMGHPLPRDIGLIMASSATRHIAAESRRLTCLRAFIRLSQPGALLAMIITSENIEKFDSCMDTKGILLNHPQYVTNLMESCCLEAIRFVSSHAEFSSNCNINLYDTQFDKLKASLLHRHLQIHAPALFLPGASEPLPPSLLPPETQLRDTITAYLGRELEWDESAWDGSINADPINLSNIFGQITWKQSYYLYRQFNICLGSQLSLIPCEHCYYEWPFFFTGKCPACDVPTSHIDKAKRLLKAKRIVRCIGLFSITIKALYNSVKIKTAADHGQTTKLIHVVPVKGFSALFLMRKGEIPDIGFRDITAEGESHRAAAKRILETETNIRATESEFLATYGADTHGAMLIYIYPTIERDIWVNNRIKYTDVEFACTNSLNMLHSIHQCTIFFSPLLEKLTNIFDNPSNNYRLLMAKCPHCRSLGPASTMCSHASSLSLTTHPASRRLETAVVGFLQGTLMDRHPDI